MVYFSFRRFKEFIELQINEKSFDYCSLVTTPTRSKEENTIGSFVGDNTNEKQGGKYYQLIRWRQHQREARRKILSAYSLATTPTKSKRKILSVYSLGTTPTKCSTGQIPYRKLNLNNSEKQKTNPKPTCVHKHKLQQGRTFKQHKFSKLFHGPGSA